MTTDVQPKMTADNNTVYLRTDLTGPNQTGAPLNVFGNFVLGLTGTLSAGVVEIWGKHSWDAAPSLWATYGTFGQFNCVAQTEVVLFVKSSADFAGNMEAKLAQRLK